MKIRVLADTTLHGKAVAKGEILEVSEGDYNNLREYKFAELVEADPKAEKVRTTSATDRDVTKRVVEHAPTFAKDHGKPHKK